MAKFRGNSRGQIRRLDKTLTSLIAADAREQAKAEAHNTVPLLFAADGTTASAMQTLIARCVSALAQK